ncbi:RHS repeat-associated core domain-containing protein, partial [Streptomyces sp. NPDC000351]|uniref:RHS repeat-associated core domain-containing protein n=1 Tax=Streptomyces sp. NPDC000351 TaxID=3154250 RepID=UPI00333250C9
IREPAGTLNSMTTGGKSYYYLTDATGNVLGLVDDAGKRTHTYAYGPTGLPRGTTAEAVPQPYRYAGAYADPTGLYKMGHRYYDSTLGRFTQPDPSGQETNPYLYAAGDPVNNTDPSGLFSLGDAIGLTLGTAVTVAATVVTGNPWVGGAIGGCVGGMVGQSIAGGDAGEIGIGCAAGAAFGAVSGGAGGTILKAVGKG